MKINYYKRILQAYLGKEKSHLTFWHGDPEFNENAFEDNSFEYYMKFHNKARYQGLFDENDIPMLDYKGAIGLQYNPIAIAQYGLGNFNLCCSFSEEGKYLVNFVKVADWLVDNLVDNGQGLPVWMHNFDFEYFQTLKSPWYSGLAQGQGISVLVRAYRETGDDKYLYTAKNAFISMMTDVSDGGTLFKDQQGYWWIEEYITDPVTHIVNGFMWGVWGVYDLWRITGDVMAEKLWQESIRTLSDNIYKFDTGYWSKYDLAPLGMRNTASFFYHKLHIVQLEVMFRLAGNDKFKEYAEKFREYEWSICNKYKAMAEKMCFKLLYY